MSGIRLPRIRFAHLPTPLETLPRLSSELGGPQIWIKRDDQTGLAFGGNKTRKLEFLLAEARAHGARTLITSGAVQSNHCRQTAAAAARFGFKCILVLHGFPPERPVANVLLDMLLGAEIIWTGNQDPQAVLHQTFEKARVDGQRPYLIPHGGSNSTGIAGYVAAMEEFLAQGMTVDRIVLASSSGGTQAGLVVGAEAGFRGQILGISISEDAGTLSERIADLANQTASLLHRSIRLSPGDIHIVDAYTGAGYAVVGDLEREAIRTFAQLEGILLDPVYTGRAAGGMMDMIRRGEFQPDERVLFWHTGGTPALFAFDIAMG